MKNRFLLVFLISAASVTHAQTVVEYVNTLDFPRSPGGQFFYSADPGEQAFVDSGGAGKFKRTGSAFLAGGSTPLCRFYGSVAPGPNSHFYTVDTGECNALKAAQITPKPAAIQQWNYEGNGFNGTAPGLTASGKPTCPTGTTPVYRAYNGAFRNGVKNAWDSNHRYATNKGEIDFMVNSQSWSDEGLSFCAAGSVAPASLPPATSNANKCANPRADAKFGDKPGSLDTEKAFVRSHIDEIYLWREEVPALSAANYDTPQAYFAPLKTWAKTASGKDKDEFHFVVNTASFQSQIDGDAGLGYGLEVAPKTSARRATIALVESGSPAAAAGLRRSIQITSVNGINEASASFPTMLQNALNPRSASQLITLGTFDPVSGAQKEVTMSAIAITTNSVPVVSTLNTPTGKVGYLLYTSFLTLASEGALIDAFTQLRDARVSDLVLDLRYNSGGYVYISSQVAYMIAGAKSRNKVFERYIYNSLRDALTNDPDEALPFFNTASGFRGTNTIEDAPLPTLNLNRVFILTADDTASASEAVINGLRGIDVDVVLIGDTTTGKPYGFYDTDNCGSTYLAVEFKGVNNKGFGDFADGFTPTCKVVEDDVTHDFTDPAETRLAAALAYRSNGVCPAGTRASDETSKAVSASEKLNRRSGFVGQLRSPKLDAQLKRAYEAQAALVK
jgi:carboxyl-terminal processing protease